MHGNGGGNSSSLLSCNYLLYTFTTSCNDDVNFQPGLPILESKSKEVFLHVIRDSSFLRSSSSSSRGGSGCCGRPRGACRSLAPDDGRSEEALFLGTWNKR